MVLLYANKAIGLPGAAWRPVLFLFSFSDQSGIAAASSQPNGTLLGTSGAIELERVMRTAGFGDRQEKKRRNSPGSSVCFCLVSFTRDVS